VRQAQVLGGEAATELDRVAHDQIGLPRAADRQQVGDHALRQDAAERVAHHPDVALCLGDRHHLRHQLAHARPGREKAEPGRLHLRSIVLRASEGHLVPGPSKRLGDRDERMKVQRGDQDAPGTPPDTEQQTTRDAGCIVALSTRGEHGLRVRRQLLQEGHGVFRPRQGRFLVPHALGVRPVRRVG
jgi:hypothetical protein